MESKIKKPKSAVSNEPKSHQQTSTIFFKGSLHSKLLHCLQIDVIYIDFAKAFDSVVLSEMLLKLMLYSAVNVIFYLTTRYYRLQIIVCLRSLKVKCTRVLSPTLCRFFFILHRKCCVSIVLHLFGDDAKLYRNVNIDDALSLQHLLDMQTGWPGQACVANAAVDSNEKNVRFYSYQPIISMHILHGYLCNDVVLPRHISHVDPWITLCSDLSF